jgi:hypothetical protein
MRGRQKASMDRRSFLRVAGGASAAAAATTLGSAPAQAYDPGEKETRSRYRETDHVKAFYRVNRYPSGKK